LHICQCRTYQQIKGSIPNQGRAQPSNYLHYDDTNLLIDVGDGTARQLGKAGVSLGAIDVIFISHLHFDHTGGLFAFLGQRYQTSNFSPLTIYGPPGIKRTVVGLFAAMRPMSESGDQLANVANQAPDFNIEIIELSGGEQVAIGQIEVLNIVNSHYILSDPTGARSQSLSFRFDLPDRSIVYSGDTGPSKALENLAEGVDLLICEIMMPQKSLNSIRVTRPDVPERALSAIMNHFQRQHVSPEEAGLIAKRSAVKKLVLTHNAIADQFIDEAGKVIAKHYEGPVSFAEDLDSF
jgi:ribonuclease BN (tRNA processing enzyme)